MPRTRKRYRKVVQEILLEYDEMAELQELQGDQEYRELATDIVSHLGKERIIALLDELPRESLLSFLKEARSKQERIIQQVRSDALDR